MIQPHFLLKTLPLVVGLALGTSSAPAAAQAVCNPRLDPYPAPIMPGETITLTGSGFGEGGGVWFGARYGHVLSYRPNRIRVTVPFSASAGVPNLAASVFCGRFSELAVFRVAPSNQLALATEESDRAVAAVVRVPRAGTVSATMAGSSAERGVARGQLVRLRLPILAGLRERVREGETLRVELAVRFTPAAGEAGRTMTRELLLRER